MRRTVIALIILVLAVAVAAFYRISTRGQSEYVRKGVETIQERKGYPVALTEVHKGEFEVWRDIQGKIHGGREAIISTPDLAPIKKIKYQVGDRVKANTSIIVLEEKDPRNRTRVQLLREIYNEAKDDYESYKELYGRGAVPKDALEKIKLKYEHAKSDLEQALTATELTSPIPGVITHMYAKEGQIMPDETLAIVSSINPVRIIAKISEEDARQIKENQPVKALVENNTISGKVDRVTMGANPDTGLFDLEILMPNPDHELKVGTYVTAAVRIYHPEDAIYVESDAVFTDEEGASYVYQVKEERAYKIPIKQVVVGDEYIVLEELDPELPVVLRGKSLLEDGARVRPRKPEGGDEETPPEGENE